MLSHLYITLYVRFGHPSTLNDNYWVIIELYSVDTYISLIGQLSFMSGLHLNCVCLAVWHKVGTH